MARNPVFDFTTPRFFTAYAEAVFPFRFFVDGRATAAAMDMDTARGFFQNMHFPDDFHRREGAFGFQELVPDITELFSAHPVQPGRNQGAGNYVPDPNDPGLQGGVSQAYTHCSSRLYSGHSIVVWNLLAICWKSYWVVPRSDWRSAYGAQGEPGDIFQLA